MGSPRKQPYTREIADYEQQMQIFDLRLEYAKNEKRGELFEKWLLLHPEFAPEENQLQELNKR